MSLSARFVHLFIVSTIAALICTFSLHPSTAVATHPPSAKLASHHARSHHDLAVRKRGANSKRCKTRPTSVAPSSTTKTPISASTSTPTPTPAPSSSSSSKPKSSSTTTKTSSTPQPSKTSSGASSGGGGGKVGIAWPDGDSSNLKNLKTNAVSFIYTWSPACPDLAAELNLECSPMLWGFDQTSQFQQVASSGSSEWYMGPNEPNETGQSNMSPESGAQLWKQYLKPLKDSGHKLVSPATSSNPNGMTWINNWLDACNGDCDFDAVGLHWYDNTFEKFQDYVELWHNRFPDKEVWVTEFACQNFNGNDQPSMADILEFMNEATQWLNEQSYVTRFYPFGFMVPPTGINPSNDLMTSGGGVTDLGRVVLDS